MNRSEMLKQCKDLNLKNYSHLKREELKNRLKIAMENRENLSEKHDGKIKIKKPRCVMIYNDDDDKPSKIYFSMNEAAKSLNVYPMQIYVLIARGKGTLDF